MLSDTEFEEQKARVLAKASGPQSEIGKTLKCVNCGELLDSLAVNCPACKYEVRRTRVAASTELAALQEQLSEIARLESQGTTNFLGEKSFDGHKARLDTISTFVVPGNPDAMIEFIALAIANSESRSNNREDEISIAWQTRLAYAVEMAGRMGGSNAYLAEQVAMAKKFLAKAKRENITKSSFNQLMAGLAAMAFLTVPWAIMENQDEDIETKRLAKIEAQVMDLVSSGDCSGALMAASSISWLFQPSANEGKVEAYNKKRDALTEAVKSTCKTK